jgi:hypothetical protein
MASACEREGGSPPPPLSTPLPSAGPSAEAPGPDGLPASAVALLSACQDATYDLQFDRAEALAGKAIARFPGHPLPRIFLEMALLARIQEAVEARQAAPRLQARFEREAEAALRLARAREVEAADGRSQLYLGSALGARGLARLLRGHYLKAYHDGQDAAAALKLALKREPQLDEAYLGLGQYDYYCGRMAGLLRFVARLHGDVKGGIAMLETCAAKGGYAATAARINLARIYSLEEPNFSKALPYVRELRRRFPSNYAFVQYALATARGLGRKNPEAQALLRAVFRQWDKGWRPPAYVKLDVEALRHVN